MSHAHLYRVERKFDNENARKFKNDMLNLLNEHVKGVDLDFTDVELVESSGLAKLLFLSEKFSERGGALKIIRVKNHEVEQLFRLLNLDRFIEIEY